MGSVVEFSASPGRPSPTTECTGHRRSDYLSVYGRNKAARVAELADALDLGSSTERCAGSSPVSRIPLLAHRRAEGPVAHPHEMQPLSHLVDRSHGQSGRTEYDSDRAAVMGPAGVRRNLNRDRHLRFGEVLGSYRVILPLVMLFSFLFLPGLVPPGCSI